MPQPISRLPARPHNQGVLSVIVHYGELALKGRNRPWFLRTLVRSISAALSDLPVVDARALIGRIVVTLGPTASWDDVRDRLGRVPGIGNFARAERTESTIDALTAAIARDVA